jgi:hypothetical protein
VTRLMEFGVGMISRSMELNRALTFCQVTQESLCSCQNCWGGAY